MASDEQETLFDIFQEIAGQQNLASPNLSESQSDMGATLDQVIAQAGQAAAGQETQSQGNASGPQSSIGSTLNDVMSQVSQLAAGGSQLNLSPREAGGGQASSSSSSEPGVINMSAEAGSRLNSAPATIPVYQYGSSGSSSSGGGGGTILSVVSSVLGGGLGVIPLVSSLLGLFGGGPSEPPPLEKYVKPDQLYFTGADTGSGIQDADYNQYGMPRLYSDATTTSASSQTGSMTSAPATGGSTGQTGSPLNLTIQALDSQSVLDRSNDIAQAVRQAMLTSSSINDVINDLQ
jgi:hypothetical protein